jgi:hypothetical protein
LIVFKGALILPFSTEFCWQDAWMNEDVENYYGFYIIVLTPKFGKESDMWVRFEKRVRLVEGRIFSEIFGKGTCGRLSASVRQRNSRADFAGLDGDVAQSGETNGWIGDQV